MKIKILLILILSAFIYASPPYITSNMSWEQLQELKSNSEEADARFGYSVAIDGDTAVISAIEEDSADSDTGTVYVYERNNDTGYFEYKTRLVVWELPDTVHFGHKVAIDSDTIVLTVLNDEWSNVIGEVYLYEKPASGWENVSNYSAKLSASDGVEGDDFGTSVAISNDVVIVGANSKNCQGYKEYCGVVYLYQKSLGGWQDCNQTAKLTPSDEDDYYRFGYSVAIEGDIVAVGAPGSSEGGTVYLFEKSSGVWTDSTESAKLSSSESSGGSSSSTEFGISVAIDNDTIAAGMLFEDGRGKVYVFLKPLSGWENVSETAVITPSFDLFQSHFGQSIDIEDGLLVVGARDGSIDRNALTDPVHVSKTGVIYLYKKPASGWEDANESNAIAALDRDSYDGFGYSVALSGDTIISGTPFTDNSGLNNIGMAYIIQNSLMQNSAENRSKVLSIEAEDPENDTVTFAINGGEDASSFKVDTEGKLSFKFLPNFENPQNSNANNTYRFMMRVADDFGEKAIVPAVVTVGNIVCEKDVPKAISAEKVQELTANNAESNAVFGSSVAMSGDTVIIGAANFNNGMGAVYVYTYDTVSRLYVQKARLRPSSPASNGAFGRELAIYHDTVAVLTYESNKAYLFKKESAGWVNSTETAVLSTTNALTSYPESIVMDHSNIMIGYDSMDDTKGGVHIYTKPSNGWIDTNETAFIRASDANTNDRFGTTVALNNNILVVSNQIGKIYLFEKPTIGWLSTSTEKAILSLSESQPTGIRTKVSVSGDTVVAGFNYAMVNDQQTGAVYLYTKPASGWKDMNESARLTASDAIHGSGFGNMVIVNEERVLAGTLGFNPDGASYLFNKPSSGWKDANESMKIPSPNEEGENFGFSGAMCGDRIIVGAPHTDTGVSDSGSVYFYKTKAATIAPIITYILN